MSDRTPEHTTALLDDHLAVEQAEPDNPGHDDPAAPVDEAMLLRRVLHFELLRL
ncbi:MAG: hypothetical protein JO252_29840 [Planctomycetaceae bacterium]|nr:hypothetical protein [Planctomycetaceae bacterium]MBV8610676.1 hypothetical protein [Singulisphaera sp.]